MNGQRTRQGRRQMQNGYPMERQASPRWLTSTLPGALLSPSGASEHLVWGKERCHGKWYIISLSGATTDRPSSISHAKDDRHPLLPITDVENTNRGLLGFMAVAPTGPTSPGGCSGMSVLACRATPTWPMSSGCKHCKLTVP
jgi:hypothetical protein